MASNVPTTRQVAWISLIPQLIFMGMLIGLFFLLKVKDPFMYGASAYPILSFVLKYSIPLSHRAGMQLVRQEQFAKAIPLFEKSLAFFEHYQWIDKFRYITLLSSSKMTYKEMALCNIAFCYSQTNNKDQAREYYSRVLSEFPENGLAKAALKMMGENS